MIKRSFDFCIAALGLVILAPLFALIAILIRIDSPGSVLFKQTRIGRHGRGFVLIKFRTMRSQPDEDESKVTIERDRRITKVGRLLRTTKIDELPQLFNVLIGEMSLVGPRPEVPEYVEMFKQEYREVLKVRPGLTDLASIKYRNEELILSQSENPDQLYLSEILPDKLKLAQNYIQNRSFFFDLQILVRTVIAILKRRNCVSR